MVDYGFYAVKIIFFIIGAIGVYKGKISYVFFLLGVPAFMTGVELITYSDEPWSYLISGTAAPQDIEKALLGGALLVMLPVLIFIFCVKDFEKLIELTENNGNKPIQGTKE